MTYDFATRIKQMEAELAALKIAHTSGGQATVYDSQVQIKDADSNNIGSFTVNQSTASNITIPSGSTSTLGLVKVDSALSSSSSNPVQNSALYTALGAKADTSSLATVATTGAYSDLTGQPTIPTVSATQVLSSGTKIGTVTVNGTDTDFYAPSASAGFITFGTNSEYWAYDTSQNQGSILAVNLPSSSINRVDTSYSVRFANNYDGALTFGAQPLRAGSTTYHRRYGWRTGAFSSGEGSYTAGASDTYATAFVTGSKTGWYAFDVRQSAIRRGTGNVWDLSVDIFGYGGNTDEHYGVEAEALSATVAPSVYIRYSPFSVSNMHREGSMWVV